MSGDGATTIWLMDSDFCDMCGAYLYPDGQCNDNSGLCGTCFDLWLQEQNEGDEDYEEEDWMDVADSRAATDASTTKETRLSHFD